jgi:outer membrane lipoprotein-sorting protein
MKKFVLTILIITVTISLSGQNINDIIEKHTESVGGKSRVEPKSMVIEGSVSQMGSTMDLKILEKRPDKFKMVTIYNGIELVQVVNGNSGYMVNPLSGSNKPVDLNINDLGHIRGISLLTNPLEQMLKNGEIKLTGTTDIEGEEVFELKSNPDSGNTSYFISKNTFYLIAIRSAISQMGQDFSVEMRMGDFKDNGGIMVPMKIDTYINGLLSGTMIYNTIKLNVEISDSEFEKK